MKTTETRTIDELGRIIIPKNLLQYLNLSAYDTVDLQACDNTIIIEKHEAACLLCGVKRDLKQYNENFFFCKSCINTLANI